MSQRGKPPSPGPLMQWQEPTPLPESETRHPVGARIRETVYRLAKADAAVRGEQLADWVEDALIEKLVKRGVIRR